MVRAILVLLFLGLALAIPSAQVQNPGVRQSGSVVNGNCVKWLSPRTIADAGAACGSGGGGSPAGSDGQVQYNNMGAFGADGSFVYNKNGSIQLGSGAYLNSNWPYAFSVSQDGAAGGSRLPSFLRQGELVYCFVGNTINMDDTGVIVHNDCQVAEKDITLTPTSQFTDAGSLISPFFDFCVSQPFLLKIIANTGQTINLGASQTMVGGDISSSTVGSCVMLRNLNGTLWVAKSFTGTWAVN